MTFLCSGAQVWAGCSSFRVGTEGTATDMAWRIEVRSRAQCPQAVVCPQLPSYPHLLKKYSVEGAQASGALDWTGRLPHGLEAPLVLSGGCGVRRGTVRSESLLDSEGVEGHPAHSHQPLNKNKAGQETPGGYQRC